jgi:hypothetical protein
VAWLVVLFVAKEKPMLLYLHPDLCKAEVTHVAPGRASGVSKPTMRVRPTTHKKTAGMQRQVQRAEREYVSTAENKPAYKCRECGAHVKPPQKQTVDRKLSPEEHLDHEAAGREVHHSKASGHTTILHPPQMLKEGKRKTLEHGSVTAEMVPTKSKAGRKVGGSCPDCHIGHESVQVLGRGKGSTPEKATAAAEAATKKSIAMLDDLFLTMVDQTDPEMMAKSLYGMRENVTEWANQFLGTPLNIDALQCLRDQLEIEREFERLRKEKKSWNVIDDMPRKQREAYHDACDKKREKVRKKEMGVIQRKQALEMKLIDHRISEAQKLGKSEEFGKPMARRDGESSNEFMSRTVRHLVDDKGYDQKRAVAAAYDMTGHPKAGKPVKKGNPTLILTV